MTIFDVGVLGRDSERAEAEGALHGARSERGRFGPWWARATIKKQHQGVLRKGRKTEAQEATGGNA